MEDWFSYFIKKSYSVIPGSPLQFIDIANFITQGGSGTDAPYLSDADYSDLYGIEKPQSALSLHTTTSLWSIGLLAAGAFILYKVLK